MNVGDVSCGEVDNSFMRGIESGCLYSNGMYAAMSKAPNESKSFTKNGGSCLISRKGEVKMESSMKD